MKLLKNERGFTLIELLFVGLILACLIASIMGNFWYTDHKAMKDLQVRNPEVVGVRTESKNIFHCSVVSVRMKDGTIQEKYLDTNIFWEFEWGSF